MPQATGRLRKNAAYFRVNYLIFVSLVTLVCFGFHPTSLIVVAFLAMAWAYLFLVRQAPIVLAGRTFKCAPTCDSCTIVLRLCLCTELHTVPAGGLGIVCDASRL